MRLPIYGVFFIFYGLLFEMDYVILFTFLIFIDIILKEMDVIVYAFTKL